MLRTALPSVCLEQMKAASNTHVKNPALMVLSFDSLRHLTVTCIMKKKWHMICCRIRFDLDYNNQSHYEELLCEFGFALCVPVCVFVRVRVCVRAYVRLSS
jgi:hypothetical protein